MGKTEKIMNFFFLFKLNKIFIVTALATLVVLSHAFAQNYPYLTDVVVDNANLLEPETEKQLIRLLRQYEYKTTNQFIVVTVPTLQGYSIETYSKGLGNYWGVGRKSKNNGILLVVAPNERRVRIEVGMGLETILTNAIAQSIIDNDILPYFRKGKMENGVWYGTKKVIQVLEGNYKQEGIISESLAKILVIILLPIVLLLRLFGIGSDFSDGGFSGGGGSFGGGGASGSW